MGFTESFLLFILYYFVKLTNQSYKGYLLIGKDINCFLFYVGEIYKV